jgi:GT2 family glycosyltransferase
MMSIPGPGFSRQELAWRVGRPPIEAITVVIPTLGREILQEALNAIAGGCVWPAELIIVDQGASPDIARRVQAMSSVGLTARYVPSSERGRAAGLNRGIEQVTTPFVAVTDDDCLVDPDWIQRMMNHLREHPMAIITGRVEAAGEEPVVALNTSSVFRVQRRPGLVFDTMCGGNLGTSRAVVEKIGMFDEDPCLRTAEDNEYGYRALRAGVTIVHAPDVVVRHLGWRNATEREAQYKAYARSHGGFYGKYLRAGDWFMALRASIHFGRALKRWLRGALTGDRELALNGRAYVAGLLPGILEGWQRGRPPLTRALVRPRLARP